MRNKVAFFVLIGLMANPLCAITRASRLKHMAAWSMASAAAWYGWSVKDESTYRPGTIDFDARSFNWASSNHGKAACGSLIPGGAMAGFVAWITSYYTPHYRYKWAQSERADLSKSVLFSYRITCENLTQIAIASGAESTGLPLVTLFLGLSSIDKTIGYMIDELECASKEVKSSSVLGERIKALLNDLHNDRVRVRENSHIVKNVDKRSWQKQWEMHNGNQMKEKEIAAMKEIAGKPQVHFQHNSKGASGLATTMLAHLLTR